MDAFFFAWKVYNIQRNTNVKKALFKAGGQQCVKSGSGSDGGFGSSIDADAQIVLRLVVFCE